MLIIPIIIFFIMIQVSSLTIQIAITGKVDMGEGAIGMVNEFITDFSFKVIKKLNILR